MTCQVCGFGDSDEGLPEGVEEITLEQESEDAVMPRVAPDPGQPTPQQLEAHRVTHNPYRSWCKWCIMVRARGSPHNGRGGGLHPRDPRRLFLPHEG